MSEKFNRHHHSHCGPEPVYIPGPAGIEGPQGKTGCEGPAGRDGAEGPIGPQGDKGDKGEQGDQGDPGIAGARGEPGVKGDTGEKGDIGDRGPQGEQGERGEDGDTRIVCCDKTTDADGKMFLELILKCDDGKYAGIKLPCIEGANLIVKVIGDDE